MIRKMTPKIINHWVDCKNNPNAVRIIFTIYLKPIDEMLADPWQVDIQELFEAFVHEPDEIKQNLYNSLYTYILQKRQEDIINRPGFVI